MGTSDNLASIEAWSFRPTFNDSWICDAFARDTETLTKALHKTITNQSDFVPNHPISPFFNMVKPETASLQTPSGSGSDPDILTPKRRNPPVNAGRITKRKSRASKRNTTTFITADPANFRQMVQQVTGVRYGDGQMPVTPVLKPEPQRLFNRIQQGCLPTLDTSAFLLDHNQQVVGPASSSVTMSSPAPAVTAEGGGFDFESFSSFPTLESWKVM